MESNLAKNFIWYWYLVESNGKNTLQSYLSITVIQYWLFCEIAV